MDQAMHHYTRAKSIVDIVSGMGKTEQEEINKNKVRPLLTLCVTVLCAHISYFLSMRACRVQSALTRH